jgi:hypothetical protein
MFGYCIMVKRGDAGSGLKLCLGRAVMIIAQAMGWRTAAWECHCVRGHDHADGVECDQ